MKKRHLSLSITVLMILTITLLGLRGIYLPAPFALLGLAVVASAALGGLTVGILSAMLASLFFAYSEFNQSGLNVFLLAGTGEGAVKIAAYIVVGAGVGFFSRQIREFKQQVGEASQRLEAHVSLLDSQMNSIISHSPVVIYLQDVSGTFQLANKMFGSCYGHSSVSIKGRLPQEVFSEAMVEPIAAQHREVVERRKAVECQYSLNYANGSPRIISATKYPVLDEGRNLLGIGTIEIDITEKIHDQKALQDREQGLDHAQRLANFGSWSSDYITDEHYWSENIYRILGYEPYSIQLNQMSTADIIFPDDRQRVRAEFDKALKGIGSGGEIGYRILRPDGTVRHLRGRAEITFDANGKPTRVMGTIQDVTEHVNSEKKRVELEKRLLETQKNETIGMLIGGIAHDFNNILTPVLGYVDMARLEVAENKALADDLEIVAKGIDEARDLMQQLRLFSAETEAISSRVDIQEVLIEALRLTQSWISSAITIDASINDSCGDVWGDKSQIIHLVVNLFMNAAQSMEEKGGAIRVELRQGYFDERAKSVRAESSESGSICISVFDSGKGVAGDEIDSIFEPHFTNDETKIKSGLGLSVVQGIVKAHNGDIFVESELGSGSVFHVCLPTVSADQELPTDEDVQPLARNTGSVLVVDDEEANLMMFMKMLKRLGYDVSVCVNGEDALAEMRSFPDRFDLLITDMMMPGMTGLELAEQIQEFKSGFPVVIMTGFAHTFDADSRESGNIKEVMQKPIKMDSLVPVIQRALEQRLQT